MCVSVCQFAGAHRHTCMHKIICKVLTVERHMDVCMRMRVCGVQGIQYYICVSFLRSYVYIFVDLVKHGVSTVVGELLLRYTTEMTDIMSVIT